MSAVPPRTTADPRPLVVAGAIIGLTWAAALRGWMIQMADAADVRWFGTFALILVPGLLVGALIGLAEQRRRTDGARSRWLTLAPVVFLLAVLGLGLLTMLSSDTARFDTAHGLWVALYGVSLLAILMLAVAIPQRIGRPVLVPHRWIAVGVGALCGFAWSSALRAFMWEVAGDFAGFDVVGTYVWILLPGTVIGALLGWAEHRRLSGPVPGRRWLIWSPMLFTALFFQDPLDLLVNGFEGGVGLAAFAVPAICTAGGYAIAGRGPIWARGLGGLVLLSTIPAWSLTAVDVGGSSMSIGNAHGAWSALLYWALLATFAMAAAIPHRESAGATG